VDNVAEVTGRSRRLLKEVSKDGTLKITEQKRNDAAGQRPTPMPSWTTRSGS
jgi:hypothetical protein